MKRSHRELSVKMVVDRFIFGNNLFMPFFRFTFTPNTVNGLPETGIIFHNFRYRSQ